MKVKEQGQQHILTVDIDEELLSSLLGFAAERGIEAAEIHGIGALRDFELGYYVLARKEYKRQKFSEIVELLSCSGNLAIREGKPFAHIHATVGFPDFRAMGGHLFSGIVAVTAEIAFRPLPERMDRAYDGRTGLYLLDLPVRKAP